MVADDLRRTALWAAHQGLGARIAPFAGWDMPVQYAGILDEARAVRAGAGVFDVSHMGRFVLSGNGAAATLERVASNAMADLAQGSGRYTLLLNEAGGVVDDIIVYRTEPERCLCVVNASNASKDLAWLREHAVPRTAISDETDATAAVAVQGPAAVDLCAGLWGSDLREAARFAAVEVPMPGGAWLFCRTGYTGEDGYEIVAPAAAIEGVWNLLVESGAVPCGLGARDVLRTEAGYPLYGHEIDASTSPVDAGLMWAVKPDDREFIGRDAVLVRRDRGAERKLMGLVVGGRVVPRQGYTVFCREQAVGTVTSGVFSPLRACGIGLAYLAPDHARAGTVLDLEVRGTRHAATVVSRRHLLSRAPTD